jgi:hypothetical protein
VVLAVAVEVEELLAVSVVLEFFISIIDMN